jgi:hypothetical protein
MSLSPTLASSLCENQELIEDLCRYADGILSEKQVRGKWKLEDAVWESLGSDEVYVAQVELARVQRIRSGSTKRELSQLHLVKAPAVLEKILQDERANPRHRIDSAKALNDLADFTPQRPGAGQERVIVTINLGADTRAKGLESDPADVLHIEAVARPVDGEGRFVAAAPQERVPMIAASEQIDQEVIPVKRGPGRPRGSKNRPKTIEEHEPRVRGVPGFDV